MGTIERYEEFEAGPDDVWAVVADPARLSDWLTLHRGWVGDPPADFAPGDRVTAAVGLLGIPATVVWTIETFEPPRALSFRGSALGQIDVAIALSVETAGAGDAAAAAPAGHRAGAEANDTSKALTGASSGPSRVRSILSITATFDGPLLAGPLGEAADRAARIELDGSLVRLAGLLGPEQAG
jgi:hypothetical protein